jgi:hypothetical protein
LVLDTHLHTPPNDPTVSTAATPDPPHPHLYPHQTQIHNACFPEVPNSPFQQIRFVVQYLIYPTDAVARGSHTLISTDSLYSHFTLSWRPTSYFQFVDVCETFSFLFELSTLYPTSRQRFCPYPYFPFYPLREDMSPFNIFTSNRHGTVPFLSTEYRPSVRIRGSPWSVLHLYVTYISLSGCAHACFFY